VGMSGGVDTARTAESQRARKEESRGSGRKERKKKSLLGTAIVTQLSLLEGTGNHLSCAVESVPYLLE